MKQEPLNPWNHLASRVAPLASLLAAALLAAHPVAASTILVWGSGYWGQTNVPDGLSDGLLAVLPRAARPGSVDLTFDPTAGGERVGLTGGSPYVNTVLPQPDGKVLIGGWFNGANEVLRNNLARLNEDGSLDAGFQPGFGTDGEVSDLALQADGKVVIIGSFSAVNVQPHAFIARLNADGNVDDTFNCRLAGDLHLRLRGLAVQSNGQIWIGGRFTNVNGVARANLARLNADGSLDASFDPQFVVSGTNVAIHRIRVQADDKLLVSGTWGESQRSLIRLNADGSLDPGFGPVVALPSGYYEYIHDMFTHSDGTIAIVGTFESVNGVPRPFAARLRANGTLDTSFNPSFGIRSAAGSVVIQPDGRIVVGGWFHEVSGTQRLGVARFNVDGSLDTSFDSANVIGRPPGTGYQPSVHALALQHDGRLIVGASPWWLQNNTNSVFRLDAFGRRDPAFATLLQAPPGGVINMALQPDGRVIIGVPSSLDYPPLIRLNPDGLVDESFHPDTNVLWLNALAVQPDGKILMNSTCRDNTPNCPSLVRLQADGSVDPSFQAPQISGFDQGIEKIAIQPDGKILVGGLILEAGGLPYGGIVRLHPDGQLDTSFHPVPITVGDDIGCGVEHILVSPGGQILIAGGFTWDTGDYAPAALALLHADGTLDSSFLANIPAFEFVGSVALQADGKFLVSGTLMGADGARWEGLVRLNADGTEDPSFQPGVPGDVGSLIAQADGLILALSSAPNGIVRLKPDGSLDPTFQAPAGLVTEAYWNAADRMILQPDGQVLVSGAFHSANGIPVHGIVRLNNDVVLPFVQREISGTLIQLIAVPQVGASVYAIEDQVHPIAVIANMSHSGVFDASTGKVKFGPFYDHAPRTLSYAVLIPPECSDVACGVFTFTGTASADGVNTPITGDALLLVAGFYPADGTPANHHLTIGEVTAYAAAWRRGETWPLPPNPIPIDYVTRAAFLWRGGECYEIDPATTNAPLWWVNCHVDARPASPSRTDAGTVAVFHAERQMTAAFVPGESLAVTIANQPNADARAYAVEDTVPNGWTASSISHGGEFDAVSGKVKWGPFLDNVPRRLNYQATPPVTPDRVAHFAGAASCDGIRVTLAGLSELRAGCRLAVEVRPGNQGIVLRLRGEAGRAGLVETSTNLVEWQLLTTFTLTDAGVAAAIPPSPGDPHRFYRATLLP